MLDPLGLVVLAERRLGKLWEIASNCPSGQRWMQTRHVCSCLFKTHELTQLKNNRYFAELEKTMWVSLCFM